MSYDERFEKLQEVLAREYGTGWSLYDKFCRVSEVRLDRESVNVKDGEPVGTISLKLSFAESGVRLCTYEEVRFDAVTPREMWRMADSLLDRRVTRRQGLNSETRATVAHCLRRIANKMWDIAEKDFQIAPQITTCARRGYKPTRLALD